MKQEDLLAGIAGQLNDVTETAARTPRHAPLVVETNALVRAAADRLVTLDSTPMSFQALKAHHRPKVRP